MLEEKWPPSLTLDNERILNLLTGERFYSDPSAALREAILNSIDAVHRRWKLDAEFSPQISVTFNSSELSLTIVDNGVGMSRDEVSNLFAKVGASAVEAESSKDSVGEFGIGVISYFMAGDSFELQTNNGEEDSVSLSFDRSMLSGGIADEVTSTLNARGTSVRINVRNEEIFNLLIARVPHWCRDVEGLCVRKLPDNTQLDQGGARRIGNIELELPKWVERAHLGPVSAPSALTEMNGISKVAVLYRGIFVQEFSVKGLWGIEGSIDVDPKHFKPRLNREGFVQNEFQSEVESFLRTCHPKVLKAMATCLSEAIERGQLDKWNERQWAGLWLSVPRDQVYADTVEKWDEVFRALPAFELARGNTWQAISLNDLTNLEGDVFVAPLKGDKSNDVVLAALRFLRNTGHNVIRGIRRDKTWMKYAPTSFSTTADLISSVFAKELRPLVMLSKNADQILHKIKPIACLFSGPPPIDIVKLGPDSPPALKLKQRLVINADHLAGKAIISDVLRENAGPVSLIAIAARHAYEQLSQVGAAVREVAQPQEVLSPIRRRYIRSCLS